MIFKYNYTINGRKDQTEPSNYAQASLAKTPTKGAVLAVAGSAI